MLFGVSGLLLLVLYQQKPTLLYFCTQNHNINKVEDEEHVLFNCPEYDTCLQEYPDLLLGNLSIKNISEFDNQETIAKLLWKIRIIRIKLGAEC